MHQIFFTLFAAVYYILCSSAFFSLISFHLIDILLIWVDVEFECTICTSRALFSPHLCNLQEVFNMIFFSFSFIFLENSLFTSQICFFLSFGILFHSLSSSVCVYFVPVKTNTFRVVQTANKRESERKRWRRKSAALVDCK